MEDRVAAEHTRSLVNDAILMVALQHRRLGRREPEDETWGSRWWTDLQLLIVGLRRLRRAAQAGLKVPAMSEIIREAVVTFDARLRGLRTLRNVGEHIDAYVVNGTDRHDKSISRGRLQVGEWNGKVFSWLGHRLDVDDALAASEELHQVVRVAVSTVSSF